MSERNARSSHLPFRRSHNRNDQVSITISKLLQLEFKSRPVLTDSHLCGVILSSTAAKVLYLVVRKQRLRENSTSCFIRLNSKRIFSWTRGASERDALLLLDKLDRSTHLDQNKGFKVTPLLNPVATFFFAILFN